jgi:predicted P-loop ATPase
MSERVKARHPSSGGRFTRDSKRRIEQSLANVTLAMAKLGVDVSYDAFAKHELIVGLDGFGPRLEDDALNNLRMRIDEEFHFRVRKDWFYDVISDRARRQRFHPVQQYLDRISWDRKPRIDRWLVDYAGAVDTRYVRAVSRIALIAGARRVRRPGSKYDEMLILESPQGCDKSQGLRTLAVNDDWFTDDLPLGADTRRFMESTVGKWRLSRPANSEE